MIQNYHHRLLGLASLAAVTISCLSTLPAQAKVPNILFIISDDLMKQVELYGNETIATPALSKLAKESLLFDRAYCQYPLCGPSRASLMLSAYPGRSGILWNQAGKSDNAHKVARKLGVTTMPAYFKSHGYITVGGGKLYHNSVVPDTDDARTDFTVAFLNDGRDGKKEKVAGAKRYSIAESSTSDITDHKDGKLVEKAKVWLAEYAKSKSDQPFFMCIGLKKPHAPYSCPKHFWDLYNRDSMQITDIKPPHEILEEYSLSKPTALLSTAYDTEQYDAYTLPDAKKKEMMHGYYACVAYIDFLVGDLVDAVKENGFYDNTIIVFTSDHGYKLGEYDRWGKFTLHEKDDIVPFLIRAPQHEESFGKTTKAVIGLIDLYPTLADLCGLPAPKNIDGLSFSKVFKDPSLPARQHISTVKPYKEVSGLSIIHENGYRYTHFYNGSLKQTPRQEDIIAYELYDHYHQNDTPISVRNIRKDNPELLDQLRGIALQKQ